MNIEQINYILEEMFEAKYEDSYGQVKYNLKPRDNRYGTIAKKAFKIGGKKIITLKTDMEEISGYAYQYIYEALLTYDDSIDNIEELDKHITLYVYDKFNKLSKDNGSNSDYYWNKSTKKFEKVKPCELKEDIAFLENNVIEEHNDSQLFIDTYFNIDYLTPEQVKFIEAINEYGIRSDGSIRDTDDNILYRQSSAWKMSKRIKNRLEKYIK